MTHKFLIQGVVHLQDVYGRTLGSGLFTCVTPEIPHDNDDQLAKAVELETRKYAKEVFYKLLREAPPELSSIGTQHTIASTTIAKL